MFEFELDKLHELRLIPPPVQPLNHYASTKVDLEAMEVGSVARKCVIEIESKGLF